MSAQRALQAPAARAQQAHGRADGPRRLDQLFDGGGLRQREWLTMAQLAEHGRFMAKDGIHFSPEAARKFVTRHPDLPRGRKGRQLLVDRAVFDRYVTTNAEQRSA